MRIHARTLCIPDSVLTIASNPASLTDLLQSAFGFTGFRINQEAVCRAAIDGRDLLLVMPTGAGKSLCYQLPAIARGGTALVISPLIALMDDQAAKLEAGGFRVARIHSGLDRAASRQACIDYLQGSLQFLFIAPERLRVPGFPEMLAKRKPTLIAIDEAHCISQWGHDFRPDYRMLGQSLPALRPAPVLALTATATPSVQADIAAQLGLVDPVHFIHGFRRDNLAIEVVEVPMPQRPAILCNLLADPARRPAIVYAPSRKQSEALAGELSRTVPAAAYHAGLDPATREQVQTAFLGGKLEIVVATIAFGMGIDKPDIRTVIHAALPATLEGYYQEIGRAGRDGALSSAFLLHSYADQRTHEFFFNRDYPPVEHLEQVMRMLGSDARPVEELREACPLSQDAFDKALEKLEIHGGAVVDYTGNATQGRPGWKKTYSIQSLYRAEQFEKVLRFTASNECRMCALVRHFGDVEDARQPCGLCDVCDPAGAVLRQFRRASGHERRQVQEIIEAMRGAAYKTPKGLRTQLVWAEDLSRGAFDELLNSMRMAGLIAFEEAEFEKDGKVIAFRKISLTSDGLNLRANTPVDLLISDGIVPELQSAGKPSTPARRSKSAPAGTDTVAAPLQLSAHAEELAARLREWRTAEAKRLGVPPYLVLHDRTLRALAHARPVNPNQLLAIDGIGPAKVERFGEAILSLCAVGTAR